MRRSFKRGGKRQIVRRPIGNNKKVVKISRGGIRL